MIGWYLIAVSSAKRATGMGDESPWTPQLWHGGRCCCNACVRYFEFYDEAEKLLGFDSNGEPRG